MLPLRRLLGFLFPIVEWLPAYGWRDTAMDDLLSAVTVATLVIPQSIAYAMLAGLKAQYGLYTAVVPVLVYSLMGTSRHLQIGIFSNIMRGAPLH